MGEPHRGRAGGSEMTQGQQLDLDLFTRLEAPPPITTTTKRRSCPIIIGGLPNGPTGDLPTLVVGLDGKEVLL